MSALTAVLARFRRDQRGAAMLEFVVVLPLLFAVMFGIIAVGQLLWAHHSITQGVRDGVRYIARVDGDPAACAGFETALQNAASPIANAWWLAADTVDVSCTLVAGPPELRTPAWSLALTATVPVPMPLFAYFGLATEVTMTVADRMRHIGE